MSMDNKNLAPKYNHENVEANRYEWWLEKGLFKARPQDKKRQPFTIIVPPPNVTGQLHLGHAWDNSLEDALIRFKRLQGFDTLFVPGMDHAGIATQTKVESIIRQQQGKTRWDLGREQFIKEIWQWKADYSAIIRAQWAKLGLALDYDMEKFTLDHDVNELVNYVFVTLYEQGLIYKGKRIVNWDPVQKTAISNIEVIYKDTPGFMFHFKYALADDPNKFLEVATTRPETMFADQCLVVNPKDERYQTYIGKSVINPVNQQVIPVIADNYVDQSFGTGVMKCTPAHDPNDFAIAERHGLAKPLCMNEDGTMMIECGLQYAGLDRYVARQKIIDQTTIDQTFIKAEEIMHQVGYSERSNAVVEPYLSDQWFVKMAPLAQSVLDFQKSNEAIEFFPKRFNDVLIQWMENPQDWTISRQLWWGHQIPAWYNEKTKETYVGLEAPKGDDWTRDPDVLDTWFSSALWPMATLGWTAEKPGEWFDRYYPTSVLVTGYDIIFFWVARMIFQGLHFTRQKPFDTVLIHGLVRDEQGRKMSKSLGNGVNPMDVIKDYGADALRFFLLTNSTPGLDLKYSEEKLKKAWNFLNKLWNASRFVLMQLPESLNSNDDQFIESTIDWDQANQWILSELNHVINQTKQLIDRYEFGLAGKELYSFVWDKYCSWYLELAKVNLANGGEILKLQTQQTLVYVLKSILIMLHPFAPFMTEYIYQALPVKKMISIMDEIWPATNNLEVNESLPILLNIISQIREYRADKNIARKNPLTFLIDQSKEKNLKIFKDKLKHWNLILKQLVNADLSLENAISNQSYINLPIRDFFLLIPEEKDDKEMIRQNLLDHQKALLAEISRSEKLLQNPNFLNKANPQKIKIEQDKYQDYLDQLKSVEDKLNMA